jgi:hypothetical protein
LTKTAGVAIRATNKQFGACHITARQLEKQAKSIRIPNRTTYKTWAVARHPLDRFISMYFHGKEEGSSPHNHTKQTLQAVIEFGRKMRDNFKNLSDPALNIKRFKGIWWWRPQADWLVDDSGVRNMVDYVIPFETIADRMEELASMTSLRKLEKMPLNAHAHPHWCNYIDTELADLVADAYRADFALYHPHYKPHVCTHPCHADDGKKGSQIEATRTQNERHDVVYGISATENRFNRSGGAASDSSGNSLGSKSPDGKFFGAKSPGGKSLDDGKSPRGKSLDDGKKRKLAQLVELQGMVAEGKLSPEQFSILVGSLETTKKQLERGS